VLNKLEQKGLIKANVPTSAKAKKSYEMTPVGMETLVEQTLATLKSIQPTYPSLLLGMIHWSVLTREQALDALEARKSALVQELERMENIHFEQQPLPDYVDVIFEFSIGQLKAEADWLDKTLAYMENKPWDE
jgi:DNA-binding PadR family transcriptional regulator